MHIKCSVCIVWSVLRIVWIINWWPEWFCAKRVCQNALKILASFECMAVCGCNNFLSVYQIALSSNFILVWITLQIRQSLSRLRRWLQIHLILLYDCGIKLLCSNGRWGFDFTVDEIVRKNPLGFTMLSCLMLSWFMWRMWCFYFTIIMHCCHDYLLCCRLRPHVETECTYLNQRRCCALKALTYGSFRSVKFLL